MSIKMICTGATPLMPGAISTIFKAMDRYKVFFSCSLCINVGLYFLTNMLLVMLTHGDEFLNDFYFTFMKGVNTIITNPGSLYDTEYHEYRNLPALTLYHYVFFRLGSIQNWDLFTASLFILYFNMGSCFLIFKVMNHPRVTVLQEKSIISNPFIVAGSYLIVSWHYFEYLHGHTHAITAFFTLLGIYYLVQEREHLAFASWSVATIFKLNIALWIFFFIVKKPFSRVLKNVAYCLVPQVPNIIMFLAWPKLLVDFIPSNIAFSLENAPTFYRVSGTISRELSYLFNSPITMYSIAFLAVFVPVTCFVLWRGKFHVFDKLMFVALAVITTLPDFWTAHALYVIPPYMVWLSTRSKINPKWKLLCFVPLMFSTPWFVFPSVSLFFFIPYLVMVHAYSRLEKPEPGHPELV